MFDIESIGSSARIEGSKLSDKDVGILLSNLEVKEFKSRDEVESQETVADTHATLSSTSLPSLASILTKASRLNFESLPRSKSDTLGWVIPS